jgi:hypothetical protein
VKAGLLYADHVTLASFGAGALGAASRVLDGSESERYRRLLDITSVLMDDNMKQYIPLLTQRRFRRGFPQYAELKAGFDETIDEVTSVIDAMRAQAGIEELEAAEAAGLLEIDDLGIDPVAFVRDAVARAAGVDGANDESGAIVAAMLGRIGDAAKSGAGTYPLFDDGASQIVAQMISAGQWSPAQRPAAEAGLAGHFVGRMPAFPDATVSEIIDARRGLDVPLVRFRGALSAMAMTVDEAPWDAGFSDLANSAYAANVAPALLDLEENARDLKLWTLARGAIVSKEPWAAAGATIMIAVAAASTMPDIAAAALAFGTPLAAAAGAAAEIAAARRDLAREREHNPFLFLFSANARLEAGPS